MTDPAAGSGDLGLSAKKRGPESPADIASPGRSRQWVKGLAARLMAAMGLALMPLAFLSYSQTEQTARVAEGRARAAILGETLMAASTQIDAILRGSGIASGLAAAIPELIGNNARCIKALALVQAQSEGAYSFVAFSRLDGVIECASTGQRYEFPDNPFIKKWMADPRPLVDVSLDGPISDTPIVVFSHPVRDALRQVVGFVTLSAPHAGFSAMADVTIPPQQNRQAPAPQPLALITFDATGTVLTSSIGLQRAASVLPQNRALTDLVSADVESFFDTAQSGIERAFAVVPLATGRLFVMGSWPSDRLDDALSRESLPSFAFPFLMWVASLLVAWIAAEALVIRHVRSLRDSITTFAHGGRQVLPLHFEGAAREFCDVGEAYQTMTAAIVKDEVALEDTIHQKEVLLREVHHRVKNNLQLIASILNMQLRTAVAPEAREAMRKVQDRVMSLATIHRELYQTSGLADVRADELLPSIVGQIVRIAAAPGRAFEMDSKIDPIRLTPDQAVPLSLFLTEGMANVIKHGAAGPGLRGKVKLSFVRLPEGMARFVLTNTLASASQTAARERDTAGMEGISDGFGSQLLQAFARQLEGQMERSVSDGVYSLILTFPLRPLTEAEERSALGDKTGPGAERNAG